MSSASSFKCLRISKALLINLKIINIIVSLLLDLHAPNFKLTFAVVAELSPPSSIDLDAFNMTTLDSVAAGPARGRGPSGRATILGELSH